jgi:hypothetical protein
LVEASGTVTQPSVRTPEISNPSCGRSVTSNRPDLAAHDALCQANIKLQRVKFLDKSLTSVSDI